MSERVVYVNDVIQVVSVGTQGPAGPPSLSAGAIVTTEGDLIRGGADDTAERFPLGTPGQVVGVPVGGTKPDYVTPIDVMVSGLASSVSDPGNTIRAANTAAIAAALATLTSGKGGTVGMPWIDAVQDFWYDPPIVMANGQFLAGAGPLPTRLRAGTTDTTLNGIEFKGASAGVTIHQAGLRNIAFVGPGSGSGNGVYIKWGTFGLVFDNVWSYGWGQDGWYVEDTYQMSFRNCVGQANVRHGFYGVTNINASIFDRFHALSNGGAGFKIVHGVGNRMFIDAEGNELAGVDLRYHFGGEVGGYFEANGQDGTSPQIYLHWRTDSTEKCSEVAIRNAYLAGATVTDRGIDIDGADATIIDGVRSIAHLTEHFRTTANSSRTRRRDYRVSGTGTEWNDLSASTMRFGPDDTNLSPIVAPGLIFSPRASNPTTVSEGMAWYRSDLDLYLSYNGSAVRTIQTAVPTVVASLNFGSIAAGATAELTITATGCTTSDLPVVQAPPAIEAGLIWSAYISATNTVTIRVHNTTAAPIDPAAGNWRVNAIKNG